MVTLARSLAHLSSELRQQNSVRRDLESVKREVRELKQHGVASPDAHSPHHQVASFEKFRGWIPSLTNPKRINKLTQYVHSRSSFTQLYLITLYVHSHITKAGFPNSVVPIQTCIVLISMI